MKNMKNVAGAGQQSRASRWLVAACIAMVLPWAALAQDAPAQKPLTSREGGNTKPNIMMTLDESGSMSSQYLPEGTFKFKVTGVTNPIDITFPANTTVILHPDDVRLPNPNIGVQVPFGGSVSAVKGSTSVFQRQMRSGQVNKQYYDPAELYLPWINVDGSRMANAVYTAAKLDPIGFETTVTVNLNTVANRNVKWCTASNCNNPNASSLSFNPALFYVLKQSGGGYLTPANAGNYDEIDLNNSSWTSTTPMTWGRNTYPARTDCAATACTRDNERQNFANWFQYHRSRLHSAQAGIPEAMQTFTDRIRVGWARLKGPVASIDGANTGVIIQGVRDFTTTQKTNLFDWVRKLDTYGGTPLRQAMYAVGKYYERTDSRGPWGETPGTTSTVAQKTCRRAYNVLVTDGYWNDFDATVTISPAVGNSDGTDGVSIAPNNFKYKATNPYRDSQSNTLADVAMDFWKRDLRPDLDNKVLPTADNPAYWQHMVNYTVGFGVTGRLNPATDLPALSAGTHPIGWTSDKIDDLWHAALNSRGQYFSANNATELAAAIRSSLNGAVERELKEAGVAAAATVLEDGNRKYIPKYRTGAWSGDVDAYQLDALGQAGAKQWSASERMPVWSDRKIFAWDAGLTTPAAVPFVWSSLSTPAQSAITNGTSTLVDFIRGDRSNEGTTTGKYRVRESIIGDIVNSTPVFAKDSIVEPYSTLPNIGTSYANFLDAKKTRPGVLYVGGNGGMLHAFRDSKGATPSTDGTEVFAYVPRAALPNLSVLSQQNYGSTDNYHRFFVDGPLAERDAYVRAPGAAAPSWRNYIVGTMGAGGRSVFALDITDPAALGASTVRWEITNTEHPELGYITAPIQVGVVDDNTSTGKWIAIFGNGYVDSSSSKANLFVVGLQDGSVTKLEVTAAGNNGLGGVTLKLDSFGRIQSVFAGDQRGNLWKMDWNKAAGRFQVGNAGNALFTTQSNQPIVQPPVLMPHSAGDWVVFGTGRLLTLPDADSNALQSLYGLRLRTSDTAGSTRTVNDMVPRTISTFTGANSAKFFELTGTSVDWATSSFRGWYVDLTVAGYTGLRVSYAPQTIADELAFFSLIAPAQNVAECEQAEGRGINLIFPIETGVTPDQNTLDTNGDGFINSSDRAVAGYATSADGIDAVLRSRTSTTSCSGGICSTTTRYSIQNTTGGRLFDFTKRRPEDPPCTGPSCPCTGPSCTPSTTTSPPGVRDRVWRRIINPPIR